MMDCFHYAAVASCLEGNDLEQVEGKELSFPLSFWKCPLTSACNKADIAINPPMDTSPTSQPHLFLFLSANLGTFVSLSFYDSKSMPLNW